MIRRLPGKRDGCEERQHKQHDGFRVVSSLDDETPKMVVSERLTDQRRAVSQTARRSRSAEGVAECYRASARTAAASASTKLAGHVRRCWSWTFWYDTFTSFAASSSF